MNSGVGSNESRITRTPLTRPRLLSIVFPIRSIRERSTGMYKGLAPLTKPEEEELARKRAELAQLEDELAERELSLASIRAELAAFERRYLRTVGVLYAELDEINAQIAERMARNSGAEEAHRAAEQARQRAHESQAAVDAQAAAARDFTPSPELKSLYREVAKRVHPDLAADAADRNRREKLMAEANQAYEQGDANRLRKILEEYETSPESVQGSGVAADLVRVIRKITQVKNRLAEIQRETQELLSSDLAKLKAKAEESQKEGRDLLAEMAERVREQIAIARRRVEELPLH